MQAQGETAFSVMGYRAMLNQPGKAGKRETSIVAVVGCGTIGSSWARGFAEAGFQVRGWDPQPGFERRLGRETSGNAGAITPCSSLMDAVAGADFVQESGPEDLGLKVDLFGQMASALPSHAVVASSTSTLMPSLLQQDCDFADRVLIGHPFNPPHILPLVEVVGGSMTAATTIETAMSFYRRAGKYPIRLHHERPGHLANRLQAALWREAVDAVATGQASVADVDAAVTLALGPRWALMGPFATFDLGGGEGGLRHLIDHIGPALEALWDDARRPEMTEALKSKLVTETTDARGVRSIECLAESRDRALTTILSVAAQF